MLLSEVPPQQSDHRIEKRGPALSVAFDADGNISRAASGFARSCGVEIDQLERRETDKGSWLYFSAIEPGRSLRELLPEIVTTALAALPVPKRVKPFGTDLMIEEKEKQRERRSQGQKRPSHLRERESRRPQRHKLAVLGKLA